MSNSTAQQFISPKLFQLIILPTENCNFRCTYCYEDYEIGQMKDETVQAIKSLIEKRMPKLEKFNISWFGGEPLMAVKVIYEINQFAQAEAKKHGVLFDSIMTTNAYALNFAMFNDMVELGVNSYQVSIDGDAIEHNKTRKLINGKETFDRIFENLLAMRANKEKYSVTLRLHVHPENIDSFQTLLPKINDAFGDDPRFSILLKPVGNYGGTSVKSMTLLKSSETPIEKLQNFLVELGWYKIRKTPQQLKKENPAVEPCYAAKPNSFVIRADGRLAKCTVAFNDPRNDVGHINPDGTVFIKNEFLRTFMRGFQSTNERELECPMSNMPSIKEVKVINFSKKVPDREAVAAA